MSGSLVASKRPGPPPATAQAAPLWKKVSSREIAFLLPPISRTSPATSSFTIQV